MKPTLLAADPPLSGNFSLNDISAENTLPEYGIVTFFCNFFNGLLGFGGSIRYFVICL
jgi:hypothetical protein